MKKHRYRIIGVALFIITVISLAQVRVNALTQEEIDRYLNEMDQTCNKNNLYEKYGPTIEKVEDQNNQYRIYLAGNKNEIGTAEFTVEVTQGYLISKSTNVVNANQDMYLTINPTTNSEGETGVAVRVHMTTSQDGCLGINDEFYQANGTAAQYGFKGTFYADLSSFSQGTPIVEELGGSGSEVNTNVGEGKICTDFINGIYRNEYFNNEDVSVIKKEDFDTYNYAVVNAEGKAFYQEFLNYCWQPTVVEGTNYSTKEIGEMISDAITSWKNYSTTIDITSISFNTDFTFIKEEARKLGNFQENKKNLELTYNLKCNHVVSDDKTDYYQNKDYYYASQEEDAIKVTYEYNYAPGDKQTETKEVCSRTCEEAVKVEYGPPVASKAGLCFEYKVKVTSYVKCNSNIKANSTPKAKSSYCTPAPGCNNGIPGYYRQAGPTEDFEECIKDCDGGKYTSKCSKKCYKEVYGENSLNLNLNYLDTITPSNMSLESDIAECKTHNSEGCYYWSGNKIRWSKGASCENNYTDKACRGRWYTLKGYHWESDYYADSNGIKRHRRSNGTSCQDVCWWEGCKKGQYLNPKTYASDVKANNAKYKAAVTTCKAAASCTTKTAEFTISVEYKTEDKDGSIKVNKIEFPYNKTTPDKTDKDKLTSLGTGAGSIANTSGNKNTTILQYAGCYKDAAIKRIYMTEWSFPGTWINNKTGEITYEDKDSSTGWYNAKDKFCVPLNALSVNTKWWEWHRLGNQCYTEAEVLADLDYNIEASTKNFGYFGWNFNISCFYALRNEECKISDNGCCKKECDGDDCDSIIVEPSENYTIRSVDTSNLFPNSGDDITPDNARKREIGFNWTAAATIPSYKNPNYAVNPEELIKDIESGAATLYDNSNLDYQFVLSPTELSTIRKYNQKYKFGTWNGTTSISNSGVVTYKSNLFKLGTGADGERESGVIYAEKVGTIGVNNE